MTIRVTMVPGIAGRERSYANTTEFDGRELTMTPWGVSLARKALLQARERALPPEQRELDAVLHALDALEAGK